MACRDGSNADAARFFAEALDVCWEIGDLWSLPQSLDGLAGLAVASGQEERAARLFGAAAAVCEKLDVPVKGPDRSEQMLTAAWAAGHALPLAEVVAEARAVGAAASDVAARGGRRSSGPSTLTPRELEVLQQLAQGHSDPQIAAALFISPHTATAHVKRVLAKLGVSSRTAAVAAAFRRGLV